MNLDLKAFQEKVVVPIIIVMVTSLGAWILQIDRSVAENKKEIEFSAEQKQAIKDLLEAAQATQGSLVQQQHEIEKQLIELQVNQRGFKEDVAEIKSQTRQILQAIQREQ